MLLDENSRDADDWAHSTVVGEEDEGVGEN
jgi:hypothetical protein